METSTFTIDGAEITVATDIGPRILGIKRPGGANLFAELPGVVIETDDGPFSFYGGHRLWRAPEVAATTYRPDDDPVTVSSEEDLVTVVGPADGDGVQKSISIHAATDAVVVDHRLENVGWAPVRCGPWAITQFPPDGVAVLPQPTKLADPAGAQPNRRVVLWPYTDPGCPEIGWGAEYITVAGSTSQTRTKLGQENRRGWLAHVHDGEVFVKWAAPHRDGARYGDLGASAQVYRDGRFLELETLGPVGELAPGHSYQHREVWWIGEVDPASDPVDAVAALDLPTMHPALGGS